MERCALVLEGGGMRGVFTAGVLDYLLDNKISFPYVVGVSAGCSNAVSYLSGQRGRSLYIHTTLLDDYKYMGLRALWRSGEIVDNKFLYGRFLHEIYPFDIDSFVANQTTFEAVATNALTGEACYLDKPKDVEQLKAICQASSSLPLVNRVVHIDGVPMVDGGLADSIPIERALELGYPEAVVVLTNCRGFRKRRSRFRLPHLLSRKYPQIIDKLNDRADRYNQQMELIEALEAEGRVVVLRPVKPMVVGRLTTDTKLLKALYDQGYAVAREWSESLKNSSEGE